MRILVVLVALVYTIGAQSQAVYAESSPAPVPRIVVDILPLHSLVSDLLMGISEPALLLDGSQSPHHVQLKPSQAAALRQADLIVMVGGGLIPPLESLAGKDTKPERFIQVTKLKGLDLLALRKAAHSHQHEEHDDASGTDPHIWLDPLLMRQVAGALTDILAARWPHQRGQLETNRDLVFAQLDTLNDALNDLFGVTPKLADDVVPYLFFHDAYQYFERRYGLTDYGTLFVNPPELVGAREQANVTERFSGKTVHCLITETASPLTKRIAEKTGARIIILQPTDQGLGNAYQYDAAMLRLAQLLKGCETADTEDDASEF